GKGLLTAGTSRKGYLFFAAFLAQFLAPSAALEPQYVALALTFALLDGAVMFGYALLGARAVRLLKRSGALWLERTCGAMLLALAGSLALYRRHAA
ncbi:LysE family transporter, partial [Burkholderia sp. WTPI3]|uniref:LysE family transporter n=1 Tax=Burkholderia sp. WTPI3 TaxID=2822167 RepID=UPI001F17D8FD